MTPANPQQASGNDDSSDDLIAELARLMAQEATSDRTAPAQPTPARPAEPAPVAPVRVPGMTYGATSSAPFDFAFTSNPRSSEAQISQAAQAAPPAEGKAAPTPAPMDETIEPFRFDFGLPPAGPVSRLDPPAPAKVAMPVHDPIADLIEADMPELVRQMEMPAAPPQSMAPAAEQLPPQEPELREPMTRGWAPTPIGAPRPDVAPPAVRANLRPANLTPIAKAPEPKAAPIAAPADVPEADDSFNFAPIFGFGSPSASETRTEPSASPKLDLRPHPVPELGDHNLDRAPSVTEPLVFDAPQVRAQIGTGDPIDEIESLIGHAVRVDMDQRQQRSVASPALRALATPEPVVPKSASSTTARHAEGADDAILEAARASGAQVGWTDPTEVDDYSATVERRGRREGNKFTNAWLRAIAGPLVAVGLLLVAGLGLYWVLGLGGRVDGPVPTLVADAAPIKAQPTVQAATDATAPSAVFNEIDGVAQGVDEQLVSRDQSDVSEVTQSAPVETNEDGLANRKVRTVTVRPDGTIVSGDEAVAGAAILPVDRPNVPVVPGAESASPELLAAAGATDPVIATAPVAPVLPGSSVVAVDAAGGIISGKIAPVPLTRPAVFQQPNGQLPGSPVNALIEPTAGALTALPNPAPVATVQVATPVETAVAPVAVEQLAAAPASNAPAYVQLSSQRTEEAARGVARDLQNRFGNLFNGVALEVTRADLGAKGIYYRVRLPASSLQSAKEVCGSVQANGGECITM